MINYPGTTYYLNLISPMHDNNVRLIQSRLCSLNYLNITYVDGYFGTDTDKAVRKYQTDNSLTATGKVDRITWNKLFDINEVASSSVNTADEESNAFTYGSNNKNSFFRNDRKQVLRKNGTDIVIVLGDNHRKKTIKDVIYRSKSFVLNAGGEPIAETYEFIARDLIESEEG